MRSRYVPITILALFTLVFFPSTASANAGTPLMWASMLHLVFGNAIIGLVEGLLLAWLFKCPKWKSVLILIAGNYASAWVGGFFVADYLASLPDITIQTIQFWFLIFVLAAFLITLLIEFPFFWFVLRSKPRPVRGALRATPLIHGVSYALLFGWYWMASGTSIMTALHVVPASEMKVSKPYSLYFLSRDGSHVLRQELSVSASPLPIAEVSAYHDFDRLFARKRDESSFDLFVFLHAEASGSQKESVVLEDFSEDAQIDLRNRDEPYEKPVSSWWNFGSVPKVATESDWNFGTGFWSIEGFNGVNQKTGQKVHFALELPFAAWPVRNGCHIAGDYLVAQLGKNQICLIHPESRRIALIARGKGPIVAKPYMSGKTAEDASPASSLP